MSVADVLVWIDRELVIAIHDRQLAEHGGSSGIRDESLLESALARPQQGLVYGDPPPDLCELAASLMVGLARNHPFVDGNKRTSWVCCRVFLALNRCELSATVQEKFLTVLAVAEGKMDEAALSAWLRSHALFESTENQINENQETYR